jgi:hypothetical protein
MVNYNNGKIYKIEAINGDEGDIYIGSTTKKHLSQRLSAHKYTYKQWKMGKYGETSCFKLFDKYGIDNCRILLIKMFSCTNNDELTAEEGSLIRSTLCINKRIPCRLQKEQKLIYNSINKDKIKDNKAKYYIENKEKISEKGKIKFTCECGTISRSSDKAKHNKSKKHIEYLNSTLL